MLFDIGMDTALHYANNQIIEMLTVENPIIRPEARQLNSQGLQPVTSEYSKDEQAQSQADRQSNINKYLIMIARLEAGLENKSISNQEARQILSKITDRIDELSKHELKLLHQLSAYKLIIADRANLRQAMLDSLQSSKQQLFNLLKDKTFIALLKGDNRLSLVYNSIEKSIRQPFVNAPKSGTRFAVNNSAYLN